MKLIKLSKQVVKQSVTEKEEVTAATTDTEGGDRTRGTLPATQAHVYAVSYLLFQHHLRSG